MNNCSIAKIYSKLFSGEYQGKYIWEHIRDLTLTCVPSFKGDLYDQQPAKVMIVGRAVNGWITDFEDCSSLETTVTSILTQRNRLDDFASDYSEYDDGKKYYYAASPFLRMMRQVIGKFTSDEQSWQQKLVWSNLYKVSPRHSGNPSWLMIKKDLSLYVELMKEEIKQNKPNVVVFVTDMNFFDPYPGNEKYASFRSIVTEHDVGASSSEYICLAGSFAEDANVKIIVCKRPERRPIPKMVDEIYSVYEALMK